MRKLLSMTAAVQILALVSGCGESKTTENNNNNNGSVVYVSADITTPTSWVPTNTYVVTKRINVTSTLTVLPGTVVKFQSDTGLRVNTNGAIIANGGSATTQITFTSFNDDSAGGDTNGNGSLTAPAPADWRGIEVNASGSTFNYCRFFYAGGAETPALTVQSDANAAITNSTFAHHHGTIDSLDATPALDACDAGTGTVITGNLFYDNRTPIWIGTAYSLDDSNRFDNSVAAPTLPQPNKYNAAFVNVAAATAWATVNGNISWTITRVPVVIGTPANAKSLWVGDGAHLTLGNSVVMKFHSDGLGQVRANGALTLGTGNVFTSIRDDSQGGDTNGDGALSTPAAGDWRGLELNANGSTFNGSRFLYAGGDDHAALAVLSNASVTVQNSVFAHNKGTIDSLLATPALNACDAGPATVIAGNTFYDNMVPLWIGTAYSFGDTNSFDNSAAAPTLPQPNKYNGVMVTDPSATNFTTVAGNITWSTTRVPLVIGTPNNAKVLWINDGAHLTLGNNVTIKFHPGARAEVRPSGVWTFGTGDILTSIRDSAHGGDTNPGGPAPSSTDWLGVEWSDVCSNAQTLYATCPP